MSLELEIEDEVESLGGFLLAKVEVNYFEYCDTTDDENIAQCYIYFDLDSAKIDNDDGEIKNLTHSELEESEDFMAILEKHCLEYARS